MEEVHGNTLGLKQSQLHALRRTYRRRVDAGEVISPELARHLTEVSRETNRQVGVLLDRKGDVQWVVVGDAAQARPCPTSAAPAPAHRLRGLRLVHTHLRGEPLTRDDLTDLALLRLDSVAAIEVKDDGLPGVLHFAHLLPENPEGALWRTEVAPSVHDLDYDAVEGPLALEEEFARASAMRRTGGRERAMLVAVCLKGKRRADAEASLAELRELARTAGVEVVDASVPGAPRRRPAHLIGKGKLEEILLRAMQLGATSSSSTTTSRPSQARHIARGHEPQGARPHPAHPRHLRAARPVGGRQAAGRAGPAQVPLAAPRAAATTRSRASTGGIGGRGPGETKLEIDRRRVRDRDHAASKRRIEALATRPAGAGASDAASAGSRSISIVGYTNAGKSTLLNALTDAEVLRRGQALRHPRPRPAGACASRASARSIITDTVGFIRDLPEDLVAAFRATLEELDDADLLLHVVDAADPSLDAHVAAVEKILGALDLSETPRLLVRNKVDRLPPGEGSAVAAARGGVAISAATRSGLPGLLHRCDRILWRDGRVSLSDVSRSADESEPEPTRILPSAPMLREGT